MLPLQPAPFHARPSDRARARVAALHQPFKESRTRDARAQLLGHRTIADSFSPQRNSLNFLRLVLALAVLFSHSLTIGQFGSEVFLGKTTLGTLAVYGFFGISGFLIAGSASRNHVGRYLWQRFLRIFPAFWMCLIVTAFVFGLIVWYRVNPHLADSCGISCYIHESGGPVGYVFRNLDLTGRQATIAHTLPNGIFRPVWDGSLWTLEFEFLCYLLLATLSVLGLLRHRLAVAVLAGSVWAIEIVVTSVPALNHDFSPAQNWDVMKMLTFVPIFLGGSLLYLYRDRIRDSGLLAVFCTVCVAMGLVIPLGNDMPTYTFTSMDLTAVFLVYPLLWLGMHLPLHKVGARNDYSYGVYIYAFPVQQLLVMFGATRWGYWPYTLLAIALVTPCAMASWWGLEKHALRLKTLRLPITAPAFGRRKMESRSIPSSQSERVGVVQTEQRDLGDQPQLDPLGSCHGERDAVVAIPQFDPADHGSGVA
jgi:peptidoglycan/LPS O-acetylase OafA/YrhL